MIRIFSVLYLGIFGNFHPINYEDVRVEYLALLVWWSFGDASRYCFCSILVQPSFWVDDFLSSIFSIFLLNLIFVLNVSKERVLYKHGVLTKFTWHHVQFLVFLCFRSFIIRLFLVLLEFLKNFMSL